MIAEQRFARIGSFIYQTHPATLPALQDGVETQVHPVAICGGGPVGLATALGLARHQGIAQLINPRQTPRSCT